MIFAIKRFETHDGDGIRTTVFFKGCSLRCKWCHNPESLSFNKNIAYNAELCRSCGGCAKICTANKIDNGIHLFNRKDCNLCGRCIGICPYQAFTIYGEDKSAQEIANDVLQDKIFYDGSGGGATFSGGEPLMQIDLCVSLAKILKNSNINIAIDTCGNVLRESIVKILPYADTFLYDVKAIDPIVHKKCTGQTNELILDNLKFIDSQNKSIEVRVPYVPDMNDMEIENIAKFLKDIKNLKRVRVLPYHNYAQDKYISLGIVDESPMRLPTKEEIASAREEIKKYCKVEVL